MSKRNIIIVSVLVLIVLGLGALQFKAMFSKDYSVVYLTTGEVYVGNLVAFPSLQLKNAYILQVTKDANDQTKTNFQLNPVSDALWAPKAMHLVRENVVFYGPLVANSKIAETLAAKTK